MKFIKIVLGTLVGLIVFFGLMFLMFMIVVGISAAAGSGEKDSLKSNTVLKINLKSAIAERTIEDPLAMLNGPFGGGSKESLGLNDLVASLEKAQTDDKIKGIYLNLSGVPTGMASSDVVREAIEDFKEGSDKFVIAYSEALTQKGYYMASVADEVYLNPYGYMDIRGFGGKLTFFKGMLDKIGVEPQVYYAGKFKSATEPFRRTEMSEANRLQTREFLADFRERMVNTIATSRNLSPDAVSDIMRNMKVRTAEDAKVLGLVDDTIYEDQFLSILRDKMDIDDEDKKINYISLSKYAKMGDGKKAKKKGASKDKIAVIYAYGNIIMGEGENGTIGSESYAKLIRKIRKDDNIKAIVLRVNSGGGSAFSSEIILRELELAGVRVPIIASMGDVAASGGYYIAAYADTILAQPNTITGSIGVFGMMPNAQKLLNEKLGVTFDTVKLDKFSDFGAFDRPMSEEESMIIQTEIDRIYRIFKERVAKGRGLDMAVVDELAQGRVYSGSDAMELGLVDVMGDLSDAIEIAAAKANLGDDYKIKEYPTIKDPIEELIKELSGQTTIKFEERIAEELGIDIEYVKTIKNMKKWQGAQARLPYTIEF